MDDGDIRMPFRFQLTEDICKLRLALEDVNFPFRVADNPFHFGVMGVAGDQQHLPRFGHLPGDPVDVGDVGTGAVDDLPPLKGIVDRRRDAVGADDDGLALFRLLRAADFRHPEGGKP